MFILTHAYNHTSTPFSDLYLLLCSATLLSVLPWWQRGVPKPELFLRAYGPHLPSVSPAGSGFEPICKWNGGLSIIDYSLLPVSFMPRVQNNVALLLIILFCCLPLHSYLFSFLFISLVLLPPSLSHSTALFSPSFCLSLVVLNVKLKQELGTVCVRVPKTPWDRPLFRAEDKPGICEPS